MSTLLLQLLLAHLLGDFVFQSGKMVRDKEQYGPGSRHLYLHLLIHFLLLLVLLQQAGRYWIGIAVIILSHGLIDVLKATHGHRLSGAKAFFLDQACHLLVLVVVAYSYFPVPLDVEALYSQQVMLFVTALLLVSVVAAILMKHLLASWEVPEDHCGDSIPYAGTYIGILERLFVFGFLVLNQWEAIGLLIAAKSIFRFSDLSRAKDRKLTEYVLLGTLLSFGIAFLIGIGYTFLAGQL